MNRAIVLTFILCLPSIAFSQQKRANYVSYETEAGTENLIQIVINVRLNAYLLDDDNFKKYVRGVPGQAAVEVLTATNPTYIVPPTKQHWHLVIDNGGRPFIGNASVRVFSLIGDLPQRPPE